MPINNHHGASPWRDVLAISAPKRTVPVFRVNTTTFHGDGGIARSSSLAQQITTVLSTPGATAEIRCHEAFARCAMIEGVQFTQEMADKITIGNRDKLLKAIGHLRSEANHNTTHHKNLTKLVESINNLPPTEK